MTTKSLSYWGGVGTILTGLFFLSAGIITAILPDGGQNSPAAAGFYYAGIVFASLAYVAVYLHQAQTVGKIGFIALVLSSLGAILLSAPTFALFAATTGCEECVSVWEFARSFVTPIATGAFLIGTALLGLVIMRFSILTNRPGLILTSGSVFWLIAFWIFPLLFPLGIVLVAVGYLKAGIFLLSIEINTMSQVGPKIIVPQSVPIAVSENGDIEIQAGIPK